MKIYISSTYNDLIAHRAAVARVLRQMHHEVVGMEEYVAEERKALDVCLRDIGECDLYVGIFAWRYGCVPDDADKTKPLPNSITASELYYADQCGKGPLAFLLDQEASWPAHFMDAITGENKSGVRIKKFRDKIQAKFLAGLFTTPEDLARQVAAAVHRRAASDRLGNITLKLETGFSQSVMKNEMISMSTLEAIPASLRDASNPAALCVDLRDGRYWWPTKLFFLASLAEELTSTRLIIFTQNGDEFVGAVTAATLRDRLLRAYDKLRAFELRCRENPVAQFDLVQALDKRCQDWGQAIPLQAEKEIKTRASVESLKRWLGADFIEQAVEQNKEEWSHTFLRDVMSWPHPFVPFTSGPKLDGVIDRAALTKRLATLFIEDLAKAYR